MHTTNYFDTLIEIAEDSPTERGTVPPQKGENKTIANLQFEILSENPYKFTSDDVLFSVFAVRKEIPEGELEIARTEFFSKGQACFRASPLTKQYGWGVHANSEGKIALVGAGTDEYQKFQTDGSIQKVKAMRSKRA